MASEQVASKSPHLYLASIDYPFPLTGTIQSIGLSLWSTAVRRLLFYIFASIPRENIYIGYEIREALAKVKAIDGDSLGYTP